MRIAEDEEFCVRLLDQPFEFFEIDVITLSVVSKLCVDEGAFVLRDDERERVIDGLLDDDGITRFGECTNSHRKCVHDAGSHGDLVFRDMPSIALGKPVIECGEVLGSRLGVAEYAMLRALNDCVHDFRCGGEVHVGDPEREQVSRAAAFFSPVEFQAIGSMSFGRYVEVIRHVCSS